MPLVSMVNKNGPLFWSLMHVWAIFHNRVGPRENQSIDLTSVETVWTTQCASDDKAPKNNNNRTNREYFMWFGHEERKNSAYVPLSFAEYWNSKQWKKNTQIIILISVYLSNQRHRNKQKYRIHHTLKQLSFFPLSHFSPLN